MADWASITAAIKTAADIAKLLRDTNVAFDKAETKLKLSELTSHLADVKMEMAGVQDELCARDDKIQQLQAALETKATLSRWRDAYYVQDEHGHPIGAAYCVACWDDRHQLRRLVKDPMDQLINSCASCKKAYNNMRTPFVDPEHPPQGWPPGESSD